VTPSELVFLYMKAIGTLLKQHLAGEVSTYAICWLVVRKDGQRFGFTSHDRDLFLDLQTYTAATGFIPSSIAESAGLKVDNLEIDSILDHAHVSIKDIEAGLYDYADIEIFLVNYNDLTQSKMILKVGKIGNISTGRDLFTAEVRSLSQFYSTIVVEQYQPSCRAKLGDQRCQFIIATLTVSGVVSTVDTVEGKRKFTSSLLGSQSDFWFNNGVITFTSGLNNGYSMEVKDYLDVDGSFILHQRLVSLITPGDTFEVYPGCDKSVNECKLKFNNLVNYRGEPMVPGQNRVISGK